MYKAIVERVIDGDTFAGDLHIPALKVTFNDERFRLYGVNTPERSELGFWEATEFTSYHIEGKVVDVVLHGKDSFGRYLVDVYPTEGGKSLNYMLVNERLADLYKK